MASGTKSVGAVGLAQNPIHKSKFNQRYEIREIDNGYIVTGWIKGEYFELYREDLKTVAYFITNHIETNV